MSKEKLSGKVLVLGDGVTAFLSVIRSLGRSGLEVHVGWCSLDCPALSSRYVHRHHILPRYEDCDDWRSTLAALMQQEAFQLVLATNEQSLLPLQEAADDLTQYGCVYLLDRNTASIVFDKAKSTKLADSLGIPTPNSEVIQGWHAGLQFANQWGYPLVLKPLSSYETADLGRRREVLHLDSDSEMKTALESLSSSEGVLLQEHFSGVGVGVELLANSGRILFAFQHERIHEPPKGGASSYRRSVPLSDELVDAVTKLTAALQFTGVMMVEFLVNPETQAWRFVEINARFWGSLPLAVAAGADFPRYLYEMIVLKRTTFPNRYRTRLYCRNLVGDLRWLYGKLVQRAGSKSTRRSSWVQTIGEYFNWLLLRERFDTITLDDPRPGFAEFYKYGRRAVARRYLARRSRLQGLPIARSHQLRNLDSALPATSSILFVCYGNICRSPFAASIARRLFPAPISIVSSGLHPIKNRRSPSTAIAAAVEWQVPLAGHRSSTLTIDEVSKADIVFTFDEQIHSEFVRQYPDAAARTYRLGILSNAEPIDIGDPYGGTPELFQQTYQRIAELVQELGRRYTSQISSATKLTSHSLRA